MTVERQAQGGERHARGLRAAGLAAARVAAPIVKRRGGGRLVSLKSCWAAIVGQPWDASTWPQALGRDGVLKLLVAPAAALELQHRTPQLLDRINLYFGRPVVTRLTFVQGQLPRAAASPPPAPELPERATRALSELLRGIGDPQLHAALLRLGRRVAAGR